MGLWEGATPMRQAGSVREVVTVLSLSIYHRQQSSFQEKTEGKVDWLVDLRNQ